MSEAARAIPYLLPHIIVALTGAAVLIADLIPEDVHHGRMGAAWLAYVGVGGLALAAVAALVVPQPPAQLLWGTLVADGMSRYFDLLFIAIAILVLMISPDAVVRFTQWSGEFYLLVVWCTLGNMLVALAGDLFALFVFLQLTSLPIIALLGLGKHDALCREAAVKYLMVVLVSTALMLYGLSLVYGEFGTSSIAGIGEAVASGSIPALAAIGLACMLAGFAFKIAAVPFQFWVPDVYQGAPVPVTVFLSVGSKVAGFALALRFIITGLGAARDAGLVFAVMGVASMLFGNLGALKQTNIKRLLAYSGIAQAGYILVGLSAMSRTGTASVLFYLAAYSIANGLAFTAVLAFADAVGSNEVSDYAGLARRSPLAAFALGAGLLSLAGLPLTVGFMAKFYVFLAAAQAGLMWLAVLAVINAVIAFYYYLRIVWNLFVPENDLAHFALTRRHAVTMVVCTVGIIALGVLPGPLLAVADKAAAALIGS